MNYYEHHIGDYIKATAHLSMLEDAAYRRLIDAYYTRETPLPIDKKACYRLVRAVSKAEKMAVDIVLFEFFSLGDDGWHQKRCDEEIEKYSEKRPAATEKKENDRERQRKARERRKSLFDALSTHGINMPWNATTEHLQLELSRIQSQPSHAPVTQPVTRDNTATQSPVTSHHIKATTESKVSNTETPEQSPPPENPTTRKGLLCRELRLLGIDAAPHLIAWDDLLPAYTDDEIIAVAKATKSKKPHERLHLNYLIPILRDRKTPPHATSNPSRKSRIDNYAAQAAAAREDHGNESGSGNENHIIDGEAIRVT